MTVRELGERMDSREFAEWVALHRFFEPLPDAWRQTGLLASAVLAPYCKKGATPKAEDFVPIETPQQADTQIEDMIARVNAKVEKKANGK
jgi:hypothetical protein